MKKFLKHFLTIFFIITVFKVTEPVTAFESWDDIYNNHKEADFERIISDEEFQNAVEAIEKINKKDKKVDKKLKEEGLLQEKQNRNKLMFERPAREEPVFGLSTGVNYNGKIIPQGFYLAYPVEIGDKYFIRLSQGEGNIVADIEANAFKIKQTGGTPVNKKITSKIIDNDKLKLTYSSSSLVLEAYLWVQ